MSTKREQILVALKAKLVLALPSVNVYRSRVYAITKADFPAIVLEPVTDTPDDDLTGPDLIYDWALAVRVAVLTRGSIQQDLSADQVADPIISAIAAAMISDKGLGGLTMDIEPSSVSFELSPGDQPIGVASLGYKIQYRTTAGDLTT